MTKGERRGLAVLIFGICAGSVATLAAADDRDVLPDRLSGLLNDYTTGTVTKGPYEMRGEWALDLPVYEPGLGDGVYLCKPSYRERPNPDREAHMRTAVQSCRGVIQPDDEGRRRDRACLRQPARRQHARRNTGRQRPSRRLPALRGHTGQQSNAHGRQATEKSARLIRHTSPDREA